MIHMAMQHLFFISRLFVVEQPFHPNNSKCPTWNEMKWNGMKWAPLPPNVMMPKIKIQIKVCDTFFYVIQVWISHSPVYDCGSDCDCWCLLRKIRFNTIKVVLQTHSSRLCLFQFIVAHLISRMRYRSLEGFLYPKHPSNNNGADK